MTRSPQQYLFVKLALMVLLTLQLVVGSFLQTARATEAPVSHASEPVSHASALAVNAAAHADCPMHGVTKDSGTTGSQGSHDCCHASACQCHCVQTPGVLASLLANASARSAILPLPSSAQFVAPRIDDFLRPPIA